MTRRTPVPLAVALALAAFSLAACELDEDGGAAASDATAEETRGTPEEGAEPADGATGTREDPLAVGETVEGADWALTVEEVALNADEAVAAENEFNEPAPDGRSYALITISATYTGADSEAPMLGTEVAWVTETGETLDAWETFVVAPDAFDSGRELYEGGTETGNIAIAVPDGDAGLIRVRLGLFDREEAFFAPG